MAGLTHVGGFPTRSHAELAVTYLAEHGIYAIVLADDAGGTYPHIALLSGGITVGVRPDDADAARDLLDQAAAQPITDGTEAGRDGPLRPVMTWVVRVAAAVVAGMIALSALSALAAR